MCESDKEWTKNLSIFVDDFCEACGAILLWNLYIS